jgi:hypothetical protein
MTPNAIGALIVGYAFFTIGTVLITQAFISKKRN